MVNALQRGVKHGSNGTERRPPSHYVPKGQPNLDLVLTLETLRTLQQKHKESQKRWKETEDDDPKEQGGQGSLEVTKPTILSG